ncbi:MAG: IS110 family transposase [Micromonosporaceae bacterium]
MAGSRTSVRTPGKSDPIDALAVARVAIREPDLPVASHDQQSRELKLLVDFRDGLVARRTEIINRMRWRLHELDPELAVPERALRSLANIDQLIRRVAHPTRLAAARTAGMKLLLALTREELAEIRTLTKRIDDLQRELAERVRRLGPNLLTVPGCGVLSAAKILAETAGAQRFRSADCYAAHAGVAPIPASSGQRTRHRLARGGNRQLNAAFHRIAITQTRLQGPGREYYQRRRAGGDTTMEAIRVLKRKIARRVYGILRQADTSNTTVSQAAA